MINWRPTSEKPKDEQEIVAIKIRQAHSCGCLANGTYHKERPNRGSNKNYHVIINYKINKMSELSRYTHWCPADEINLPELEEK